MAINQNIVVDRLDNFTNHKNALKCRINPLVLMTILDAYARKPKKETRAIGTETSISESLGESTPGRYGN